MKKNLMWFLGSVLIGSFTLMSFQNHDRATCGLSVGDHAPNFRIPGLEGEDTMDQLSDLRGRYVVVSFWAGYDAPSRMANVALSNALHAAKDAGNEGSRPIELVSVSFDPYHSVFEEIVREDSIGGVACFQVPEGENSRLFAKYRLSSGFATYLLNERGVIVARDLTPSDLVQYLN